MSQTWLAEKREEEEHRKLQSTENQPTKKKINSKKI